MIRSNHISQGWINVDFIIFVEEDRIIWDNYISILSHSHVQIRDYEDKIISENNPVGLYMFQRLSIRFYEKKRGN